MMTIEYRSFTGAGSAEATDDGHVFGLAIPYNRVTTIGDMDHGGFREQIAPGACAKSLREADIVALHNHNSGQPLGRTSAGNLTLKATTRGIEPDLVPIDTTYGADLIKNVKAGITRGWSFGFEVVKDDWQDAEGRAADEWTGTDRTIREMKLIEVSPVTFPAYEMTTIAARARSGILGAREAKAGVTTQARAGSAPGDGSKPYGDVTYADPGYQKDGKKRYPLDTKSHAKAAWSYINQDDNASAYNSEQLASIKAKIKAACKKFGVAISDDEAKAAEQAGEWREKAKAKREKAKVRRARKQAREARALHCVTCGSALRCLNCNPVKAKAKASKIDIPADADPNVYGANHGVLGAVTDGGMKPVEPKSAEPGGETRAAKATYADIETCGECGATSQYGAYCASCGEPMKPSKPQGDYCTSCGAKLDDGDRDKHVCTIRGGGKKSDLSSGTSKRIPQINALLDQALKLISGADIKSLPDDVQTAIALVSSAATHASHIADHEGLEPADSISANDAAGRSAQPKPDDSTSENLPDDKALILARMHMISRDVALGF